MAERSDDFDYNLSFGRFALLLIGLLTLSLLIGAAVAHGTELTVYESMSVIGVLSSIALSAILAFLYYRMSRIQDLQRQESVRQADLQEDLAKHQEKQNDLMELQQEMQELEYQPQVLIDDYEITQSGVEITLRNLGRGLAEHIAVRSKLRVADVTVDPEPNSGLDSEGFMYNPEDVFYRDSETGDEFVPRITNCTRADSGELLSENRRGGMLSPDEGAVTFKSRIRFGRIDKKHDGVGAVSPGRLFDRLYEQELRDVWFYLDLVYCNELGELSVIPIMGKSGELERGMDVSDIESLQYNVTGTRHEVEETIKSLGDYPPT